MADIDGFSLHAAVRCGADDRQALAQLCRYITRLAIDTSMGLTPTGGLIMGTRSGEQVIARLCDLSGPVAFFSHGQFGRVLAARWIGLPVIEGQHFAIDPASVGILSFEAGHPQRRVIALWNASPRTG